MSSAEENKATVRRYVEDAVAEVRSGNLAATDEILTSDATFYDPGQPPSVGTEAQKQRSACSSAPSQTFGSPSRTWPPKGKGSRFVGPCVALIKVAS